MLSPVFSLALVKRALFIAEPLTRALNLKETPTRSDSPEQVNRQPQKSVTALACPIVCTSEIVSVTQN